MSSFIKNIHWLIFGLILIVVYTILPGLITRFTPQISTNYSLPSYYATGEAFYDGTDQGAYGARAEAFKKAEDSANEMARLLGKKLGRVTSISDNPHTTTTTYESSPSAMPYMDTYSVSINYELK